MMLASCSNDEVVEQAQENAISFRSMMSANTRGVVADVSNLNTLCVTAYQGTTCTLTISYTKRTVQGSLTLPNLIIGQKPVN